MSQTALAFADLQTTSFAAPSTGPDAAPGAHGRTSRPAALRHGREGAAGAGPGGPIGDVPSAGAPTAGDRSAVDSIGFAIGWDHARWRVAPPADHLHAGHPVRQGWLAGRATLGRRTLRPTAAVRRWLHLRLRCWLQGVAVEPVQVGPAYLARLEVATCPVTRRPLGPGSAGADGATVERLHAGAAAAGGNLAVMSHEAGRALGGRGVDELLAIARRLEADAAPARLMGLDAAQWLRAAVLASLATPLPHDRVASLPLVVMPPPRVRVMNPVQALQVLLTRQFLRPGHSKRVDALSALFRDPGARLAFRVFMLTLHARRLSAGFALDGAALEHALEDAWQQPLVQQRWQRLSLRLTPDECERIVRQAARRGLGDGGWRWIESDQATDGWSLAA